MTDWSTPADRLATVDPVTKPVRNWVWWVNFTCLSVATISVACVAIAYAMVR